MGYKAKTTIRVDLSDLGDNNGTPFFVEIKNPKMMTFGQKLELGKSALIEDQAKKLDAIKGVVGSMITAWNLIDIETEQPVDVKAENALDRVPSEVVEKIMLSIAPPKQDEATKNSSEQSARP